MEDIYSYSMPPKPPPKIEVFITWIIGILSSVQFFFEKTMRRFNAHFNMFWKYRFLLKELVRKNVRLKYRNSALGMFWNLLQPLLAALVLWFVFSNLRGRGDNDGIPFILYILSGRILFSFFSDSTTGAMNSMRNNSGIIKKVYVPKYIYPMSVVISRFVTMCFSMVILAIFITYFDITEGYGYGLTPRVFFAVVPIGILFVFSLGVGLFLSAISIFVKDLIYIYSVFCRLVFYISPIIFSPEQILTGSSLKLVLRLNPLYGIIQMFRNAVFVSEGNAFANEEFFYSGWQLLYTFGWAVIMLLLGTYIFYKRQDKFIHHI